MRFKCPLCKKNNAKRSYAYPESIVCYCGGELKEVSQFQNGELKPYKALKKKRNHPAEIIIAKDEIDDLIKETLANKRNYDAYLDHS